MRSWLYLVSLVAIAMLLSTCAAFGQGYIQTNLVSDGFIPAANTDANLVNSWGLAAGPTSPFWVADNGTGVATIYDGNGNKAILEVTIPTPAGGTPPSAPTGAVFNGSSNFPVGGGSSRFIFVTEDGTISGWPGAGTNAILAVDNSANEAIYKGVAIADSRLYAADFHNNAVNIFDANFNPVSIGGAFQDPNLPAGYAPFNISNIGGNLYVTYALQDAAREDDVPGPGFGYVDVFDTNGALLKRFASQGTLNAPWGMAVAPGNFAEFSNALLIGNFGDGTINAFNPATGAFLGQLKDQNGNTISIDGLWALEFGNGADNQFTGFLFFTSGPGDEKHGLYGSISPVPEPASLVFALMGLSGLLWRKRT